jgi:hypothetical protein
MDDKDIAELVVELRILYRKLEHEALDSKDLLQVTDALGHLIDHIEERLAEGEQR